MQGLLTTLKKIFFWNYARNTWQWDVLCVLILVFIFLTPKSLFPVGERPDAKLHQRTLLLTPESITNEQDRVQIRQRVKALTGESNVEVLAVRKVVGSQGQTLGFEVDIR